MKVCYVDETGHNSSARCLIMVGVLVDATRLNKAQRELTKELSTISEVFPGDLSELKGSRLVSRKGGWSHLSSVDWASILDSLCSFVQTNSHSIVLAAVDKRKLRETKMTSVPSQLRDEWLAAGLHIALQIQHMNRNMQKNKGKTFLIFDDNKQKADRLSELLWNPPPWTDDYYQTKKKLPERLDQIINTPYAIKSHHESLVQLADVYAAILRRYVEVRDGDLEELWSGEHQQMQAWAHQLSESLVARRHRWPNRPKGQCATWYTDVAPTALIELGG